jgi:hypothetical protein
MEAGYRTPLLDFFKRGEVAADVRLLAAQGVLAPRAHEQLALLMLLVNDSDAQVASTAEATIQSIPAASLSAFLARSDVPSDMADFFGRRGVVPAAAPAEDVSAPMISTGDEPDVGDDEDDERSAMARLATMSVPQKVARAIRGTREERAILIRDPNKMVVAAVMSCPKLTDTEVEGFARMANVSQEVLRIISGTRQWMKKYGVVSALTKNAKTPVAVSLNLLPRLTDADLRLLSTNRNVPDVVRIAARKKLVLAR